MKRIIILLIFLLLGIHSIAQSLKVMTYNIRLDVAVDGENAWPLRKDFLTSQIQFYEPDIFGIQEARPDQVADISNGLSQYSQVGMGREGEGKGESSNIYYKK
ncbi:MAG: endonuclease, partial [Bacteroidales bacterium]|nr:endonuclease [Bacteroidales bacterium]